MKYIVEYAVTIFHEIEIEAESAEDAMRVETNIRAQDIKDSMKNNDFFITETDLMKIVDENGNYIYR